MDFWERMRGNLDKGLDRSRDWLGKAGDKAKDLGDKGVLRFEISQLQSQAEKLMGKLGTRAYEALEKEGQPAVSHETSGVSDLISQIKDVHRRIEEKEERLRQLGHPVDPEHGEPGSEGGPRP
jgi:hypothetical protein